MKSAAIVLAMMATASAFTPQSVWARRPRIPRVILQSKETFTSAKVPVAKMTIETIKIGGVYEGVVTDVCEIGAFVDFENQNGRVRKSQLADEFVANPADVVSVGQKVSVRVLSVDLNRNKISLSMKSGAGSAPRELERKPRLTMETLEVGGQYEGTVKRMSNFGAFVNFGLKNQNGLVHKSELADEFVANPADVVSVGQKVVVRVLSVDLGKKQISLSMKSRLFFQQQPQKQQPQKQQPQQGHSNQKEQQQGQQQKQQDGANRKAVVTGADRKHLMTNIDDDSDEGKDEDEDEEEDDDDEDEEEDEDDEDEDDEDEEEEEEEEDDEDEEEEEEEQQQGGSASRDRKPRRRDLKFYLKNYAAITTAGEPIAKLTIETIKVDDQYEGKVIALSDFGAFVDFGLEKQNGLVHKSELDDTFVTNPADAAFVGQQVSVRVLSVDLGKKQISLSMKSDPNSRQKTTSGKMQANEFPKPGMAFLDYYRHDKRPKPAWFEEHFY